MPNNAGAIHSEDGFGAWHLRQFAGGQADRQGVPRDDVQSRPQPQRHQHPSQCIHPWLRCGRSVKQQEQHHEVAASGGHRLALRECGDHGVGPVNNSVGLSPGIRRLGLGRSPREHPQQCQCLMEPPFPSILLTDRRTTPLPPTPSSAQTRPQAAKSPASCPSSLPKGPRRLSTAVLPRVLCPCLHLHPVDTIRC